MKLEWHNTDKAMIASHTKVVEKDLARMLDDLEGDPSGLVFHHIFLTKDYNGPCVFVWGEKDSDAFHCEYCEKTVWKTAAEIDAEANKESTSGTDDAKLRVED